MNTQRPISFALAAAALLFLGAPVFSQAPDGPQPEVTPPTTHPIPTLPPQPAEGPTITVPAGTRIGVILENGISTATAKAGDSVYFRTSFPITISNKVVVPVGSYLRGEVTESKRPGRVKGRGQLRIRLDTMVFPNGYTVDLNAEPHSTDGGQNKTDAEGKITGPGGKGKDVGEVAATTVTGAGIGAIAGGAKGAGIGAGIGGAAGLIGVLVSRGPDAHLTRGSSMDLVLERDLELDSNQIRFPNIHSTNTVYIQQPPPQNEQ